MNRRSTRENTPGARKRAGLLVSTTAAAAAAMLLFSATPAHASESVVDSNGASCAYQYSVKLGERSKGSVNYIQATSSTGSKYKSTEWDNSVYTWRYFTPARSLTHIHWYSSLDITHTSTSCVYNP